MELSIEQALRQGVAAHKEGRLQDAERLYRAILQSQPLHPDANHNLGVLEVSASKSHRALSFFKTALDVNPKVEQFWLSYIDALIKEKQFENAKLVIGQAKTQGAAQEKLNFLQIKLQSAAKENELKSIRQKKNITLKEKRKNFAEAKNDKKKRKQFKSSINPPTTELNNLLLLYQNKQFGDAEKLALSITQEFPKHSFSWKVLGAILLQLGRKIEAANAAQKSVELSPQDAEAYYNLGVALRELGRHNEAETSYNQAIALKTDYAEAHNNLGITLHELCRFDEAEANFKQAVALQPNYAEAHNNLGSAHKELLKLDEAEASYTRATVLKPDFAQAHYNLGVTLQELGRLDDSLASYKQAITLQPDYAQAHSNLGVTLRELGRLDESVASYKQAIALKPDFTKAHNNLGLSLLEFGRLKEAEASFIQAIALKSDYAEAHNNLGNTLKELDRLVEAEASYIRAIAMNSNYAVAHYNLGITLQKLDRLAESTESYKRAIQLKPDFDDAYYNLGAVLEDFVSTKHDTELQKIVITILDKGTYVRPEEISRAAISLLKFEPLLQKTFKKYSAGELAQGLQETISNLSNLPLLLKLMCVCPIPDLELEGLFQGARSCLLLLKSESKGNPGLLRFQSALALQCFTNEYIYSQTVEESSALKKLELEIERDLSKGKLPSSQSVLCLASYKALYEYEWCKLLSMNSDIAEVYTRQILEPIEEIHLRSKIPALKEITNKVSSSVQAQYEENPYPRWVNLGLEKKPKAISEIVKDINLRLYDNEVLDITTPHILVAGCGTGQHSIGTASRVKSSEVLAVDLSLSSIAYAKRKTEEFGLPNLEYMQADILDLGTLERQFNVIESAGVLHHMEDPLAGWRVLTSCLSPGGLMRIGLYSELARQHILQIRDEIDQIGLQTDDDFMRSFRKVVINSDEEHHKQILLTSDFYSLSNTRDLLFHVQEHRFSIPLIKKCLDELGLEFCGFEDQKLVNEFKRSHTEQDSPFDLDKWHSYEEKNPRSFYGMYQFWCQKIN